MDTPPERESVLLLVSIGCSVVAPAISIGETEAMFNADREFHRAQPQYARYLPPHGVRRAALLLCQATVAGGLR